MAVDISHYTQMSPIISLSVPVQDLERRVGMTHYWTFYRISVWENHLQCKFLALSVSPLHQQVSSAAIMIALWMKDDESSGNIPDISSLRPRRLSQRSKWSCSTCQWPQSHQDSLWFVYPSSPSLYISTSHDQHFTGRHTHTP